MPVAYDWLKIIVIRSGTGWVIHDDRRQPVWPGDAVVLMPGVPCAILPDPQVRFTRVFLSMRFVISKMRERFFAQGLDGRAAAILGQVDFPVPSQVVHINPGMRTPVEHWMRTLTDLTRQQRIIDQWWTAESTVTALIGQVVPLLERQEGKRWPTLWDRSRKATLADMTVLKPLSDEIAAARTILQNEFTSPLLSVTRLPERVGLSESRFFAAFKAQMGKTPKAYLDSLRVQSMCHLLLDGSASVAEVARRVGWDSPWVWWWV